MLGLLETACSPRQDLAVQSSARVPQTNQGFSITHLLTAARTYSGALSSHQTFLPPSLYSSYGLEYGPPQWFCVVQFANLDRFGGQILNRRYFFWL